VALGLSSDCLNCPYGVIEGGAGNGRVLSLTDAGSEKLAELHPTWSDAQQQAYELMGVRVATSIKRRVDDVFAELGAGESLPRA
jgi:hypothetical protein